MFKILLIQPQISPDSIVFGVLEPLSLEVLASAILKESGLRDVKLDILDMRLEKNGALEKKLRQFDPDVTGITGITIDYLSMLDILTRVKKHNQSCITVVGGHHATMAPEEFYIEAVDFIVRGPGHVVLPRLIRKIACSEEPLIPGVLRRTDKGFAGDDNWSSNQMCSLPLPDRTLTGKYRKKYRQLGRRMAVLNTSQGCPFRCNFCSCWKFLNGKYLARSAEDVVEELSGIEEKDVFIADDHTFSDIKRVERICDLIKERGIKKKFQAYARADSIVNNPDIFRKWKEAGLDVLTVGVETGSDEELDFYNKNTSTEVNYQASKILNDIGITNHAHFIIRPSYTKKDFERLWDCVYKYGVVLPAFPILTPLPGTKLIELEPPVLMQHGFFDLTHPITECELPFTEFVSEWVKIIRKSYSVRRYLKAKIKKLLNLFIEDKYPWNETVNPSLHMIFFSFIYAKFIIHQKMKKYKKVYEKECNEDRCRRVSSLSGTS